MTWIHFCLWHAQFSSFFCKSLSIGFITSMCNAMLVVLGRFCWSKDLTPDNKCQFWFCDIYDAIIRLPRWQLPLTVMSIQLKKNWTQTSLIYQTKAPALEQYFDIMCVRVIENPFHSFALTRPYYLYSSTFVQGNPSNHSRLTLIRLYPTTTLCFSFIILKR